VPTTTWFNLPEAKRERVLMAALTEFAAKGFSAGSLNVVAREAGIAKGSLFQYFADKRSLYAHVCDVCSRRIRDEFTLTMLERAADHADLFGFLRVVLVDWVEYFRAHRLERDVIFAANFEVDADARRAVREVMNRHYQDVLEPLVRAAADSGQLRPDASTDHLIAMLLVIVPHLATAPFSAELDPVLRMQDRDGDDLAATVGGFVDLLEHGYAAPPDQRPTTDLQRAVTAVADAVGVSAA
jgi:AcrR family transcriptional regulator